VYCFTRKSTESLAERLTDDGIRAVPYHAGLEQPVRARHQDMFLSDEVRVVCATIAFGMGIDKATSVRGALRPAEERASTRTGRR
jgi:ATP-dependent DNA helicase RecQ